MSPTCAIETGPAGPLREGATHLFAPSLTKCEATGNAKALAVLTQISPAAWRHILLNGHYTFQSDSKVIDLDTLVAGVELA
ncbi:hypothetical protein AT967_23950 [Salmonella enterica subsp. enterica serovar Montevideo]|uniref:Transposase n=4 Tax=Salmonella enterica TaxID=28901 RepID=A0A5X7QHE9_SALMO|nr:hypothetical protein [Salmonella enterica subsp. enterica serovar Cerro]EAA8471110.1 hypothetical protein [Salmonella enterica]EAC1354569.1 hypothetical protein [Salmonella enterica subsp. enterica serovar Montevideo]EAP4751819.1 hypothetical protein [Salmonella enterica subsp. enterica serovar Meleagridis]EAW1973528.1 hypothetical protein [Salmonella enterica subsp. enterica]EBB4445885.1 hypothetical protein [Salmonella enterica subsp. enterica serovar Dublin]EBC9787253.1 hypothetical pro